MAAAGSNAQSELSALERGMHALHSKMTVKAYAETVGRARSTVHSEVYAAEVAEAVPDVGNNLSRHFSQLVEIHAAPDWLWPALVARLVAEGLSVEATRRLVETVKAAAEACGHVELGRNRFLRERRLSRQAVLLVYFLPVAIASLREGFDLRRRDSALA